MRGPRPLARALLWAALIAGCGGQAQPAPTRIALPPDRVPLPDHPPCQATVQYVPCVEAGRAVEGTLMVDGDCIWLALDNGQAARIVWPFGWSLRVASAGIFDNRGMLVANPGDRLIARGSDPAQGVADACGRTTFVTLAEDIGVVGADFNSPSIEPR